MTTTTTRRATKHNSTPMLVNCDSCGYEAYENPCPDCAAKAKTTTPTTTNANMAGVWGSGLKLGWNVYGPDKTGEGRVALMDGVAVGTLNTFKNDGLVTGYVVSIRNFDGGDRSHVESFIVSDGFHRGDGHATARTARRAATAYLSLHAPTSAPACDYCNDKGTKAAPCDACGEGRY
jgi:hypothetical protein